MKRKLLSTFAVLVLLFQLACGIVEIAQEVVSGGNDLVAFQRAQGKDTTKAETFLRGANAFLNGLNNAKTDGQRLELLPSLASLTKSFREEFKVELQATPEGALVAFVIDSGLRRLSNHFTKLAAKVPPSSVASMSGDAASDAQSSLAELNTYLQTEAVKKPKK